MRMTLEQAITAGIVPSGDFISGSMLDGGAASFVLPVEIISEMNWRGHWAAKYRRAKKQKRMAYAGTLEYAHGIRYRIQAGEDIRLAITLIRIMRPRQRRFDSDNLASGFKAIRDGVASALGIDDGDDRLEWHCAQEPGDGMHGGVRVMIARVDF